MSQLEGHHRQLDPSLFDHLRDSVITHRTRHISAARQYDIIPGATYFEGPIQPSLAQRNAYIDDACERFDDRDVVFVDPDNGMEVSSCRIGTSRSPKCIYYEDIRKFFELNKSVIIFQHYPKVNRHKYLEHPSREPSAFLAISKFAVISTPYVAFFFYISGGA